MQLFIHVSVAVITVQLFFFACVCVTYAVFIYPYDMKKAVFLTLCSITIYTGLIASIDYCNNGLNPSSEKLYKTIYSTTEKPPFNPMHQNK